MNKILIVYIATGLYSERFNGFKNSVPKFCPGVEKTISLVSDLVTPTDELMHPTTMHHIDHMPWPLVATLKQYYIKMMMDKVANFGFSHVFYFNSNIKFYDKIKADEFLTDKIIAVEHCTWRYQGCNDLNHTWGKPLDSKLKCYIDEPYTYLQSSVFGGPWDLMYKLCNDCIDMASYDLAHRRMPPFEDESYHNKWCHDNSELVTILDANYNADYDHKDEYGYPNPKIVMMNSDNTQYEYKDKFFE